MKRNVIQILVILFLFSCNSSKQSQWEVPAEQLPKQEVFVKSYGKVLFELDTLNFAEGLKSIQADYAEFLSGDLNDSANILKLYQFVTDTQLRMLYQRSMEVFPDMSQLNAQISKLFSHLSYHFPDVELPAVFTYISGVQFDAPVLTTENSIVVALDCYLGDSEPVYTKIGIPAYQSRRMTPEHITTDIARAIYESRLEKTQFATTILDEMVQAGKQIVFLEAMQPDQSPHILLGYSTEQMEWIIKNEHAVWATLVSEELLYKGDQLLFRKLFGDGPFTQDFSQDAPPRLGEYIGWRIVQNYVLKQSDLTLASLLQMKDSQDILTKSKYKPAK